MSIPAQSAVPVRRHRNEERPLPVGRVFRSYAELELPLPGPLASVLPLVFVQHDPPLRIPAGELSSTAFCATLPAQTLRAVPQHLRVYLQHILSGQVDIDWLSSLTLNWQPHFLALFSTTAQRRLRAIGLLNPSPDLNPVELLVTKAITAVHDLTVLVRLLSFGPTPRIDPSPLEVDLQQELASPRKRLQASFVQMEAPEKWRSDPLSPVTFVFSDAVSIHHTDCRFAWLIHLLCKHGPTLLVPPAATSIYFPSICDRFASPQLQAVAHALRDGVSAAQTMTVQQEIEDIASKISRATRNRSRTAGQITMRYGCDGTIRSLGDLGEIFSVSRQVVHVQTSIARSLCTKADFTPALRRLVAAVDQHANRPIAEVEQRLRPLLGPSQSLEGALQFAKDFFGLAPATKIYAAKPPRGPERVKFIGKEVAHRSLNLQAALHEKLFAQGVGYVTDLLANRDSNASFDPTLQDLHEAVAQDPAVVWLGPDQRWLLSFDPKSPLVAALRQMGHVAFPHPLPVALAAEGLRVQLDRDPSGLQPSTSLLLSAVVLLAPAAGLSLESEAVVLAANPQPLDHISRSQATIYQGLVEAGGFLRSDTLRAAIPSLSELSAVELHARLTACCFVCAHPQGYLLRGWPQPAVLASAATSPQPARPYRVDGHVVHVALNNSGARRVRPNDRLLYLPSPLPELIHGTFTHADGIWPDIMVKGGRVHYLAPIATALGVLPGASFLVEFDLASHLYRVSLQPLPAPPLA